MTRTLRVLIAEDNDDHRLLAELALHAQQGVHVDTVGAQDGEETLAVLRRSGPHAGQPLPDLVLLDLSMPRVDGLSVLRQMREDPDLRHLPVVVLTSSSRPEDVDAAYALGANSYVNKSAGLTDLARYWTSTATLPSHGRPAQAWS